ncbi:phosphoglycerate kinase, partial [Candidatus Peregrinibacteria bacterium RIFOXYB2_FULL_32_7]
MNLNTANLASKKVLLRVDFNTPLQDNGEIEDDSRIVKTIPTIKFLLEKGAKQIIIITHLGRPKGEIIEKLKTDVLAKKLEKLLKESVIKINEITPKSVPEKAKIIMLENLRFDPREKKNDDKMARELAKLADIYVNDAFGASHREHTSIVAITKHLPSYAGLLLQKEIDVLSEVLKNPKKPLTVILGGAKIDTKIGIIKNFLNKADNILVGGGIANTFLYAQGYDIGQSLYEKDKKEIAQEIMMTAEIEHEKFVIPKDVIVASEAKENAVTLDIPIEDLELDMKIFDIGKETLGKFSYQAQDPQSEYQELQHLLWLRSLQL